MFYYHAINNENNLIMKILNNNIKEGILLLLNYSISFKIAVLW